MDLRLLLAPNSVAIVAWGLKVPVLFYTFQGVVLDEDCAMKHAETGIKPRLRKSRHKQDPYACSCMLRNGPTKDDRKSDALSVPVRFRLNRPRSFGALT